MTFIVNPLARIITPIFTPIDESDPSLAIRIGQFTFAGLTEGASIAALVAGGQAALRARTFDAATTGWSMPIFTHANGRPAMRFDGIHQIKNFAADATAVGLPTPQTVFWQFLIPSWSSQPATSRLLSTGASTATNVTVRPLTSVGGLSLQTVNANLTLAGVAPEGVWASMGIVFAGTNSLLINAAGAVSGLVLDPVPLNGQRLGGNAQSLTSGAPGFRGQISKFEVYTRAMSPAELVATWAALAA